MAEDWDHRVKKKRRRVSSASDMSDSGVIVKEEKAEEPVAPVPMDETVEDEVSDVEDDGHFPHLLHLAFPMISSNAIRISSLQKKGFMVKTGRFSEREKEQMVTNMAEIMNSPPVSNFWSTKEEYDDVLINIVGIFQSIKTKSGLKKRDILGPIVRGNPLTCPYRQFYFRLGRGLPHRLIAAIVHFCRDFSTPLRNQNALTDDEINKIVEGKRQLVPSQQLAYENDATPQSVFQIVRNNLTPTLDYRIRKPFTFKDDMKLVRAIRHQLSLERIEDYDKSMKIDFNAIAIQVHGRNYNDCRDRFRLNIIPLFGKHEITLLQRKKKHINMDKAKILYLIHKDEAECEFAIDWSAIRVKLPHMPMATAMRLFDELLSKVPEDEMIDFSEKVEWLMENEFPNLTKRKAARVREVEDFYDAPIYAASVK